MPNLWGGCNRAVGRVREMPELCKFYPLFQKETYFVRGQIFGGVK